jgi:4'-phosphopantetheinyl transferase
MALVAICLHRRVGIDIEQIHSSLEWESIARYYFTSTERSELQALPPAHRLRAFIRYWVRKEAYVKALGTGLGSGLDHFEISVELNISSGRVRPLERVPGKPEWSFQDIPVGLDYEAAIVLEGVIPRIECWFCERG